MIRRILPTDRELYLRLAEEFYASDAVSHPVPRQHFERCFEELMRSDSCLDCRIFEHDCTPAGYALLVKSYSQEAGGPVIWIDELYILPEFRSRGLGTEFLRALIRESAEAFAGLRLEVEPENHRAIELYKSLGFRPLPYSQLVLDLKTE